MFGSRSENKKNAKKNIKIRRSIQILPILAENFWDYMTSNSTKKRLVANFHNLTPEQQEAVKELYPHGFTEVMTRIDKPNGDFFYVVPYETDDTSYLVKIDVKIDDSADEAVEDDFYGDDEIKGADDIQDDSAGGDDDEGMD